MGLCSPVLSNTGSNLAATVSSRGLVKSQEGSFCATIKRVRRGSPKELDEVMLKSLSTSV